ncbi:MAG: hypothetical protein K2X29_05410 [Candidatus Obscuribacterales bacterium]|nr:hypothetical protein [Candidatus Obscuribacterales bacterium]
MATLIVNCEVIKKENTTKNEISHQKRRLNILMQLTDNDSDKKFALRVLYAIPATTVKDKPYTKLTVEDISGKCYLLFLFQSYEGFDYICANVRKTGPAYYTIFAYDKLSQTNIHRFITEKREFNA